jgi:excisionase family DNA binding protein
MKGKKGPERHYTVAEVAAIYCVTPRTIRNWVDDGSLRAWRRGRLIRIPKSALDEFDGQS